MSLSIAIITKNEELNLQACLESITWADEIVLVDSGSTDRTLEIAKSFRARIFDIPFTNFANQKNEALSRCSGDWIFLIDADERVPENLAGEIQAISKQSPDAVYSVHRATYFFGKPMNHGGTQNDYPIRLYPKGRIRYTQPVHEMIETDLPIKKLSASLIHHSTRDLSHYRIKLNRYIPFEIEILKQKSRHSVFSDILLRPIAQFLNLYIVRRGFLDGLTGLQYAGLSSYYTFRKYWLFYFSGKGP